MSDDERARFIRLREAELRGLWLRELFRDAELIAELVKLLPEGDSLLAEIRSVGRDWAYIEDFSFEEFEGWAARLREVRAAARRRVC